MSEPPLSERLLSRLTCPSEQCPSHGPLRAGQYRNEVQCSSCGAVWNINDLVKPYARVTGQWIIGGAAAIALGYGQAGTMSALSMALGGSIVAFALTRIVWQYRALKPLKTLPFRPD